MGARSAVLRSSDRQCPGVEIDLGPLQIHEFARSEAMPEGHQDHGLVPVRPAIALTALDEPLDLAFGQVLAGAHIGVLGPARRDFPFYGGWRYDSQDWFWHMKQCSL